VIVHRAPRSAARVLIITIKHMSKACGLTPSYTVRLAAVPEDVSEQQILEVIRGFE